MRDWRPGWRPFLEVLPRRATVRAEGNALITGGLFAGGKPVKLASDLQYRERGCIPKVTFCRGRRVRGKGLTRRLKQDVPTCL
jgi:hypothetical protein